MLHLPTTLRLNSPHQQSKNVFAALVLSHRFGYMAPEMKPLAALLVFLLAASPAVAQLRLGESGLALNPTTTVTSDYIFRGISQTRSRPAAQANVELLHPGSGVYIGSFVSNARTKATTSPPRSISSAAFASRWAASISISWVSGIIMPASPGAAPSRGWIMSRPSCAPAAASARSRCWPRWVPLPTTSPVPAPASISRAAWIGKPGSGASP